MNLSLSRRREQMVIANIQSFYKFKHSLTLESGDWSQLDGNTLHVALTSDTVPTLLLNVFFQINLSDKCINADLRGNTFVLYGKKTSVGVVNFKRIRISPMLACLARQTTVYEKLSPADAKNLIPIHEKKHMPKIYTDDMGIFFDVHIRPGDILMFDRGDTEPPYYRVVCELLQQVSKMKTSTTTLGKT